MDNAPPNWGQLDDCVLAVYVDRKALFELLDESVSAKYEPIQYPQKREWDKAVRAADVLTQWDPEYDLCDHRMKRMAIQIGLRGNALRTYASDLILQVSDVSGFVRQQRTLRHGGRSGESG